MFARLNYSPPASRGWTTDRPHRFVPQLYPQGHLQQPTTWPGVNITPPTDSDAHTDPRIITGTQQPPGVPSAPAHESQPAHDSLPQDSPHNSPPTASHVNTTSMIPTIPTGASPPPDAPPTSALASRPAVDSPSRDSSHTPDDPTGCDDFSSLFGKSDDKPETLPAQTAAQSRSQSPSPSLSDWGDFSNLVNDWEDQPDTAPGGIPPTMSNEAFAAMLFESRDDGQ